MCVHSVCAMLWILGGLGRGHCPFGSGPSRSVGGHPCVLYVTGGLGVVAVEGFPGEGVGEAAAQVEGSPGAAAGER